MLSVAICTYSRSEQLRPLLAQLASVSQRCEEICEVLVINNGGDSATTTLIEQFSQQMPIREVVEPTLGLSNARNRALTEFKTQNIWFLDDDTSVHSSQTVKAYLRALRDYPRAGFFGGPLDVEWSRGKPAWLRDDALPLLNGLLGHYNLGKTDRQLDSQRLGPYGANFLLRRSTIEQVGKFDASLGVNANELGRGEETDYFRRSRDLGINGYYIAGASVGHRFQEERINLSHLWRYGKAKGAESAEQEANSEFAWRRTLVEQFMRGCWQLIKGRRDRFYQCWINMGAARGRHESRARESQ